MGNKVYIGNLSYAMTDSDLQELFKPHGTVESAHVIVDRDTGRSKGFGFVIMTDGEEAQAAIADLNNQQVNGRTITVNKVQAPEEPGGSPHGFAGGRGGFRGGRRY